MILHFLPHLPPDFPLLPQFRALLRCSPLLLIDHTVHTVCLHCRMHFPTFPHASWMEKRLEMLLWQPGLSCAWSSPRNACHLNRQLSNSRQTVKMTFSLISSRSLAIHNKSQFVDAHFARFSELTMKTGLKIKASIKVGIIFLESVR